MFLTLTEDLYYRAVLKFSFVLLLEGDQTSERETSQLNIKMESEYIILFKSEIFS